MTGSRLSKTKPASETNSEGSLGHSNVSDVSGPLSFPMIIILSVTNQRSLPLCLGPAGSQVLHNRPEAEQISRK